MSTYYDDEDVDYHDDMPEFQDEAEFDDYLNDEEYQLMSEIFPRAKKELDDYQGWDNLRVKVALFEHNFDFDQAMIDLKRTSKKKKQSEIPQGKMSTLEQLARQRALSAKKSTSSNSPETPTSVSLLSALQRKSTENTTKHSLSDRLSTLKDRRLNLTDKPKFSQRQTVTQLGGLTAEKKSSLASLLNRKGSADNSRQSLGSKLSALKGVRRSTEENQSSPKVAEKSERKTSIIPNETEIDNPRISFEKLCSVFDSKSFSQDYQNLVPSHSKITNIAVAHRVVHNEIPARLKRRYDEIFTVFYPDTNSPAAKKKAIQNFKKPSPDDVILEAQTKAFEAVQGVTKDVQKLAVSETVTDDDKDDDDDDDSRPKDNEPVVRSYKKATTPTKPRKPVDIGQYVSSKKPHLSFVVLGHVDAGKSTLMGRLLYDVGAVDNKLIRKLKRESEVMGKSSFHLAWVMDQTSEERARGVTVDICTSDFETDAATFTIVDAPGHRDFVPNAIAGVSQVDVAVLSVDCSTDAFESGFNLDGQTKEHTLLARSLGVRHIVVAMNKMDSVDWYEGRFMDIQYELRNFFEDIGIKEEQLSWVPCSGLSGEGVYEKEYPIGQTWYKGPSLVNCLEEVAQTLCPINLKEISESPFVFSILDATPTSRGQEVVVSGRVESGSIQSGETITIYPSEQSVVVDSILSGNDQHTTPVAIKGDFVALKLRNAHYEDIQGGDLASIVGYDIPSAQEFSVQLLTFQLSRPLLPGTSFMLFRGGCEQPARVKKLIAIVDKSNTQNVLKKKVRHLGSNQAALLEIELTEKKRRISMLTFEQNRHLGRIVLRKDGRTIAAGIIKSLDL